MALESDLAIRSPCMVLTKVMRNPRPASFFASCKLGVTCPWAGCGMRTACEVVPSSFPFLPSAVSIFSLIRSKTCLLQTTQNVQYSHKKDSNEDSATPGAESELHQN
jgi:hypothetical protein